MPGNVTHTYHSGILQNGFLFLATNFTFFKDRDDSHQADTADSCRIQRRKGTRPAGQAKDRRAVGNHSQPQFGKAVADQVSKGAFDTVRRTDSFLRDEPYRRNADQQLRAKDQEA